MQLQAEHEKLSTRANEQDELRSVINHLEEFSQQLSEGIETLDWISKREVIRALVKRVEVGKEDVRVVYKIGQLPFVQGPASGASLQGCLWRGFTYPRERVSALCVRSVGRSMAKSTCAR